MEISQRTATLADAAVLLTWRNNERVREFSVNPEPISSKEHLTWFSARIERAQFEPFLFFVSGHNTIGMTRLDCVSESFDKLEISILVDPNLQGNSVGTRILNMTCETFFNLYPGKTIVARVHKQNFISQKLFKNAGFERFLLSDNFFNFEKVFKQWQ